MQITVGATITIPRLIFSDMIFCAFAALRPLGITLQKQTGVFWHECIERGLEQWKAGGADYVITMDYDSVFTYEDVKALLDFTQTHPYVDAVAALQVSRHNSLVLFWDDKPVPKQAVADAELFPVKSAHFGLTLIRLAALEKMEKPWFHSVPGTDGGWGEGRTDADVAFWKKWVAAGNSLFIAPKVHIGHMELMVKYFDKDMEVMYQHPNDWWTSGPSPKRFGAKVVEPEAAPVEEATVEEDAA